VKEIKYNCTAQLVSDGCGGHQPKLGPNRLCSSETACWLCRCRPRGKIATM